MKSIALQIAAAFLALAPVAARAADVPHRIVSLNVCADQLLLALADPDQIAALSIYAADPSLSFLADKAVAFPHNTSAAEQVVARSPDLVLAGTFTKRATREMITRLAMPLTLLPPARSVDQSIQQIRQIATAVGHPERGEALVADIETARARAKTAVGAARMSAAAYQRRGYVTGAGTLTDDLLQTVGLIDSGKTLTTGTGGFVSLEKIVANPPSVLIVNTAVQRPEDQGSALLSHPVLAALYPPERRIVLPDRLTTCGGPSLPAAFDLLAAEAKRVAAIR